MFGFITRRELDRILDARDQARDMEWSEWFDKFRRLYARISRRVERQDEPAPAGSDGGPVTGAAPAQPYFSRQWELAQLERTRLQEYGRALKGG